MAATSALSNPIAPRALANRHVATANASPTSSVTTATPSMATAARPPARPSQASPVWILQRARSPPTKSLPVVIRDFIGLGRQKSPSTTDTSYHLDFNRHSADGIFKMVKTSLSASGKPEWRWLPFKKSEADAPAKGVGYTPLSLATCTCNEAAPIANWVTTTETWRPARRAPARASRSCDRLARAAIPRSAAVTTRVTCSMTASSVPTAETCRRRRTSRSGTRM